MFTLFFLLPCANTSFSISRGFPGLLRDVFVIRFDTLLTRYTAARGSSRNLRTTRPLIISFIYYTRRIPYRSTHSFCTFSFFSSFLLPVIPGQGCESKYNLWRRSYGSLLRAVQRKKKMKNRFNWFYVEIFFSSFTLLRIISIPNVYFFITNHFFKILARSKIQISFNVSKWARNPLFFI